MVVIVSGYSTKTGIKIFNAHAKLGTLPLNAKKLRKMLAI